MVNTKNVTYALAAVFLLSGIAKLAGLEFEVEAFQRWGYPEWFMILSGVIEVAGALGLLIPRLNMLVAACLALFMTGAVGTHIIHYELPMACIASGIMLAAGWLAWEGLKN
ncbi:MAG TPA: DoxX family protein [Methylophilaceae bacterium]|nr:DoxX family protein [Methylophilaceae bacterium]